MQTIRKKTVLIIDDSGFMRSLIKDIMQRNGFRVVGEAENGKIGAEKYKILKPDIVTTDVIMDDGDGMSALEQILEYDPNAKVIVISSMISQKLFAEEALQKGAKAVVDKPVEEVDLVNAIMSIF